MKIVFFGGIPKRDVNDLLITDINGTAALYSYFLRKEYDKMGIETDYCVARPGAASDEELSKIDVPKGDHIISMAQRGFNVRCKTSKTLYNNVRKNISGKITSICDHATQNPIEDIIFYGVPQPKALPKNVYVGCAIDHNILTPQHDPSSIRILVDHSYYGVNPKDISAKISMECLKFQRSNKVKPVIIRRFSGPTGVETVTPDKFNPGQYDRSTSMPYPNACDEYKKCDIFFVTHPESLGLSVLESAACGAYVVCPSGYIKDTILNQVRHIGFDGLDIPWNNIISELDIQKSRSATLKYTWTALAKKILKNLES